MKRCLLPTRARNVEKRKKELDNSRYAEKHKVAIRQVRYYEGNYPKATEYLTAMEYQLRFFPDGLERHLRSDFAGMTKEHTFVLVDYNTHEEIIFTYNAPIVDKSEREAAEKKIRGEPMYAW